MTISFPSHEFDDAVAGVCHGTATDEQMEALNALLRSDAAARDEYLICVELHTRLASSPDLFAGTASAPAGLDMETGNPDRIVPFPRPASVRRNTLVALGLAASFLVLLAAGVFWMQSGNSKNPTSRAVAVISQALNVRWHEGDRARAVGEPLEPGWMHIDSGLVQIAFYSGARLVVEGPARVRLVSPGIVECERGRLIGSVPPQARGFQVRTPVAQVVDLGTEFGIGVMDGGDEVHVFKGKVQYEASTGADELASGQAVRISQRGGIERTVADPDAFSPLFDLQSRWEAMLRQRYESWKTAGARLNGDPSLIARFDFEGVSGSSWRVPNVSESAGRLLDGSIVGCQMSEGRWPGKKAVEFQRMNDRVRLEAPVALQSLTLAAWVNVRGLDREYNSLFMSDGFAPGGIHWQIHNSGKLDLHVKGVTGPHFQTCLSPAVITLDKMGQWMFLAAVVDVAHREVVHYLNGQPVSRHKLEQAPPFLLGPSDLGNWNPMGQPGGNPFLIRHFGGAMDEFLLFNRALTPAEIEALHTGGKPEPDAGTGSIQARSGVRE